MSLQQFSSKIEDILDQVSTLTKPYVPFLGRFLLVVTFLEDSLRICSQWTDQVNYLMNQRRIWWGVTHVFLIVNVLMMIIGSTMAIIRKKTMYAVGMLFTVIVSQALGYGLIFDFLFFMRNLAVTGGLVMLLVEERHHESREKSFFPGLPDLQTNKTMYLQLAGRILLVLLFSSFVLGARENFGLLRFVVIVIGAVSCIMVAVGFKAKKSAFVLVMLLSCFNVIINNWWSLHHSHPQRDFLKYDFFQTLSVVGGLILLTNLGPGNISLDEKKKAF